MLRLLHPSDSHHALRSACYWSLEAQTLAASCIVCWSSSQECPSETVLERQDIPRVCSGRRTQVAARHGELAKPLRQLPLLESLRDLGGLLIPQAPKFRGNDKQVSASDPNKEDRPLGVDWRQAQTRDTTTFWRHGSLIVLCDGCPHLGCSILSSGETVCIKAAQLVVVDSRLRQRRVANLH